MAVAGAVSSIEQRAQALLTPTLAECVRQRTAAGVAKYGQTLDDNHQPMRARAVHLIQELLDGVQYALWCDDPATAEQCAALAAVYELRYGLSAEEIMQGGKS